MLFRSETVAFEHRRGGILALYQDTQAFDQATEAVRSWREIGASQSALDRKGCIDIEPSLAHSTFLIAGAIHTPHDESGDCYAFTCQLAERAKALGVTFKWNTTAKGFKHEGQHISHAITDRGDEAADAFVLAMGSYSPQEMQGLDLTLPIYPAKGYSVTAPVLDDEIGRAHV